MGIKVSIDYHNTWYPSVELRYLKKDGKIILQQRWVHCSGIKDLTE